MAVESLEYLGRGLVIPFEIDSHGDFNQAEGVENVRSAVRMLIGTRQGDLIWDPGFGLNLDRLRHAPLGSALKEEALRQISEGFGQEPRVQIVDVNVERVDDGRTLTIELQWAIRGGIEVDGQVVFSDTVRLPAA